MGIRDTLVLPITFHAIWPFTFPQQFTPVSRCFWPLGRLCNIRVWCNIPAMVVKITETSVCRDAWRLIPFDPSSEAVILRSVRHEDAFSKSVVEEHTLSLKKKESEVAQSCLTLCDPLDCSPPGSSVHGIFQTRVLEWVAISFCWRSSQPRIKPGSPALQAVALLSLKLSSKRIGWDGGNFLGAQWLRLHLPMKSTRVWSLVGEELRSHMPPGHASRPKKKRKKKEKAILSPLLLPHISSLGFLTVALLTGGKHYLIVVLISVSLIMRYVDHLFMYPSVVICVSSFWPWRSHQRGRWKDSSVC